MSEVTGGPPLVVLTTDEPFSRAVCDILAAHFPRATMEVRDPATLRAKPEASAAVIDARADAARGTGTVERLRATGFEAAVVVITDPSSGSPAGGDEGSRALGFAEVAVGDMGQHLLTRLAEQMESASAPHAEQVMRARRLVSAGQIALGLQHALNNPIAGLMAEAQLMQFETVTADQAAALQRMVDLCRRLVELTRSLDGVGERRPRAS